jgi:hypothetical protein
MPEPFYVDDITRVVLSETQKQALMNWYEATIANRSVEGVEPLIVRGTVHLTKAIEDVLDSNERS